MRAGVDNRLHGAIVAIMELALFFLPISIIQYMVRCVQYLKPNVDMTDHGLQNCWRSGQTHSGQFTEGRCCDCTQPTYFYGALLVMFGVDISNDWLIHAASKVSTRCKLPPAHLDSGYQTDIHLIPTRSGVTYLRCKLIQHV